MTVDDGHVAHRTNMDQCEEGQIPHSQPCDTVGPLLCSGTQWQLLFLPGVGDVATTSVRASDSPVYTVSSMVNIFLTLQLLGDML